MLVFVVTAQSQPPAGGGLNPNNTDLPQLPPNTLLNPADLKTFLQDKNASNPKSTLGSDASGSLNKKINTDSLVKESTPQSALTTESTYGMQLFRGGAVASITELSTPPLDYPIGVYDKIIVSLWNGAEATLDYTVARDGSIFPTGLGKIYVQGLTFEQVRALIIQRFKSYVPATTNIAVSLGEPRTISVNVAGEVNTQGPVTVSAFTNAFNVIALAGGPTDMANLRAIQIKRNGKVIDELDVYKYLTTGDFGKHIYLENNDFVIVQTVEKKVKAEGKFKRPMYYQLKKDEGLKALLKYSGGLTNDAFSSGVKVFRTELEQQIIKDVNATAVINPTHDARLDKEDFGLQDGDIVRVIAVNPGLINKVEVKGEVSYPGQYEIRAGDKLFDIINRAGGITRNTYLPRAYIFRGSGDSTKLNSNRLDVDLTGITQTSTKDSGINKNNVELYPNDQVLLFNANSFSDRQYVEIFGEVRKEGKVNKYGGMTLQDLLFLSGGLKQSAEYGRIEIASVLDIDSAKREQQPTHVVLKTIKINPSLDIDSASAAIILKPYDQIYVRKNPTFELQQLVQINGLIKYPGPYPRLNKYERLSSYIDRAGGIKENADLSGAILYRKKIQYFRDNVTDNVASLTDSLGGINKLDSVKTSISEVANEPVSIDLYRAMKYRNSKFDVILQEGDVVFIPEINPFVNVKGTVQSPLKLTYDKEHTSLMYYIDKAGGYGRRPWKSRVYVQYANGKSKRTKNLFFFHFYPKVAEGSTVNVPFRPEGADVSDSVKQIVISTIPIITATIIAKILVKL
ncbi:MAG: SLBB domain-containing protein [Bacteroidetes bacterium]|nr:SLBB domain-containing protein [Bacteroidota bacterium]